MPASPFVLKPKLLVGAHEAGNACDCDGVVIEEII